jgi:phage gpG-like protein
VQVAARVDIRKVERALRAARRAGVDLRPVWKKLRKPLRDDQKEHGKEQQGPDAKWAPLAPATLAQRATKRARLAEMKRGVARRRIVSRRRRRKAYRQRRILGRLPYLLELTSSKLALRATSKARWSLVHQEGGVAGKKARIKARPFLWISKKLLRLTAATVREHVAEAWSKGAR